MSAAFWFNYSLAMLIVLTPLVIVGAALGIMLARRLRAITPRTIATSIIAFASCAVVGEICAVAWGAFAQPPVVGFSILALMADVIAGTATLVFAITWSVMQVRSWRARAQ